MLNLGKALDTPKEHSKLKRVQGLNEVAGELSLACCLTNKNVSTAITGTIRPR